MERFTEILRRLKAADVEFSLIGGMAAIQYGASYVTYDVDVCARFNWENLQRIHGVLKEMNPRWIIKDMPFELNEELASRLKNLYLKTDLGRLDCLSEVKGVGDFDAVMQQSELVRFPFGECYVLRIQSLIQAKEAMGRTQDKLVVSQLRAIMEKRGERNGPTGNE